MAINTTIHTFLVFFLFSISVYGQCFDNDVLEPNDDTSTATPLAFGQSYTNLTACNDVNDFFSVNVTSSTTDTVLLIYNILDENFNAFYFSVYGENIQSESTAIFFYPTIFALTNTSAGTYSVSLITDWSVSTLTYYNITARQVSCSLDAFEPNSFYWPAEVSSNFTFLNGTICGADTDVFEASLSRRATITEVLTFPFGSDIDLFASEERQRENTVVCTNTSCTYSYEEYQPRRITFGIIGKHYQFTSIPYSYTITITYEKCADFLCPDGNCVDYFTMCETTAVNQCNDTFNYIQCFDSTCVSSPLDCLSNASIPAICFGAGNELCWDGSCRSTGECDVIPSCPLETPKRCHQGCVAETQSCTLTCSPNQVQCPTGECVSNTLLCTPFDGCALGLVKCPNGRCVQDYTECRCSSGGYLCFNGSCATDPRDCEEAPVDKKPARQSISIGVSSLLDISVLSEDLSEELCSITVGPYTFTGGYLTIAPIADSILQNYRHSAWGNKDYTQYIYSSAMDISVDKRNGVFFDQAVLISCKVTLPPNTSFADICLGFINRTSGKWECTDRYLDVVPLGDNMYQVTGRTYHFTNFGVLLGDSPTKESDQQSSVSSSANDSSNYIYYAIAGGVAGFLVLVGIITSCIVISRRKQREQDALKPKTYVFSNTQASEAHTNATEEVEMGTK